MRALFMDFSVGCFLPAGQPHILLLMIGAIYNNLSRCIAMDSEMHLVQDGGNEKQCADDFFIFFFIFSAESNDQQAAMIFAVSITSSIL